MLSLCCEAPLAGVVGYDGRALMCASDSHCSSTILRREGDQYQVSTTCRGAGDGSPVTPITVFEVVVVHSSTSIGVRYGDHVMQYQLCRDFGSR